MRAIKALAALLTLAVALWLLAARATAGTILRWETRDGGLAFTDNPKQVPSGYRDAAVAVPLLPLGDYPRLTVEGPEHAEQVKRQLQRKRGGVKRWPNGLPRPR